MGAAMAMKPHCAACGFDSNIALAGCVRFADYEPDPNEWRVRNGLLPLLGSRARGEADFCQPHLEPARQLRHLTLSEAVKRIRSVRIADDDEPPSWDIMTTRPF